MSTNFRVTSNILSAIELSSFSAFVCLWESSFGRVCGFSGVSYLWCPFFGWLFATLFAFSVISTKILWNQIYNFHLCPHTHTHIDILQQLTQILANIQRPTDITLQAWFHVHTHVSGYTHTHIHIHVYIAYIKLQTM